MGSAARTPFRGRCDDQCSLDLCQCRSLGQELRFPLPAGPVMRIERP
jgi:hypothetical protein